LNKKTKEDHVFVVFIVDFVVVFVVVVNIGSTKPPSCQPITMTPAVSLTSS
jgi:hypothetical protein